MDNASPLLPQLLVEKDGKFVSLVLRDNQTSEEHPDDICTHKDVQHIKKENIGLIEVMGLA